MNLTEALMKAASDWTRLAAGCAPREIRLTLENGVVMCLIPPTDPAEGEAEHEAIETGRNWRFTETTIGFRPSSGLIEDRTLALDERVKAIRLFPSPG
jgi:hypothetical protein